MRRWWMKNFFNERNRAPRLSLSIMKELKIKNKTASSNIDFLNTINAIELSRARCRNITTLSLQSHFFFLFSFFLPLLPPPTPNPRQDWILFLNGSFFEEINGQIWDPPFSSELWWSNWKYNRISFLSKHLFSLILPARFYRKRKSKLAIKMAE